MNKRKIYFFQIPKVCSGFTYFIRSPSDPCIGTGVPKRGAFATPNINLIDPNLSRSMCVKFGEELIKTN